jgi:hypothetical protein
MFGRLVRCFCRDYEAGTWTPGLQFGGATTGITYLFQEGNYTRIGDMVFCSFTFHLSSLGTASGTAEITGFPYAVYPKQSGAINAIRFSGLAVAYVSVLAQMTDNTTTALLQGNKTADLRNDNFVQKTDLRNTAQFDGSIAYRTFPKN